MRAKGKGKENNEEPELAAQSSNMRATIKIWEFDPISPRLLHTVDVFAKWPPDAITSFAVLEDCTQLAVGLRSGAVLLMRGEPYPTGKNAGTGYVTSSLQLASSSSVSHLYFSVSQLDDLISVYVVMQNSINSYFTTHEDVSRNPRQVALEVRGCEQGQASLSNGKQHLVVGQEEAVVFYTPETKARVFPIPGAERKQHVHCFEHYLLVACATPQGQTAISIFDMRKGASYVAFHMKLGAVSRPDPGRKEGGAAMGGGGSGATERVLFVVETTNGGSGGLGGQLAESPKGGRPAKPDEETSAAVLVVTSKHRVYRLVEKDTRTKLEILFRKNLYATAIQLAYNCDYDEKHIAEIYRMHGDHLHTKGDYDGATREYCNTVGHVSPSYVICKFLDAHRVHNLSDYLEALHAMDRIDSYDAAGEPKQSQAHPLHTTLLLNCYTKLKAVAKLNQFVQSQDESQGGGNKKYKFDAGTAIKVLRLMYPYHALHLAKASKQHAWYLRIVIDLHKQMQPEAKAGVGKAGQSKSGVLRGAASGGGIELNVSLGSMGMGLSSGSSLGGGGFEPMLEALEYMWRLDQSLVMEYLPSYGKSILTSLPDETTQLIIALCTGRYKPIPEHITSLRQYFEEYESLQQSQLTQGQQEVSSTSPESPEQFIHLFVEHPELLRQFLSTIVKAGTNSTSTSAAPLRLHPDVSSSALVGNTLLELLLQEDEEEWYASEIAFDFVCNLPATAPAVA
jgi:hypothetical protein